MKVEEFVDWIGQVEKIFGYFEVPETKKVKLVSMNFRGRASYWWEHYRIQRSGGGEEKIRGWENETKIEGTIFAF